MAIIAAAVVMAAMPLHSAVAQGSTGRVVGRVLDSETGRGLVGARITVQGSSLGTLSGVDGRYILTNVPAGSATLLIDYIGYAQKTVSGVNVMDGSAVPVDISLSAAALAIDGITVTVAGERGSVSRALDDQRTAVGVVNAVTSEQMSRSPDSDAAQAVQRVSGVTVRDGKYVFVRGLGERYTTTSLNGTRVPSPEPEKKVVPLDLFPSSLLEAITTSKTFTPDQPGDFSGAQVNLRTKTFPGARLAQLSMSGGYNTQSTGQLIPKPITVGGEWLGLAASDRNLPTGLTSQTDFSRLDQGQINSLIRAFPNTWSFDEGTGAPNASAGISVGGEDPILGQRIGYIGSLSYSRSLEVRENEIVARAVAGDAEGTPIPFNEFQGQTGVASVLWGGLVNLSTYIGTGTKIEFNNTYDRTADNEAHEDWGTLEEFAQVDSVRRTSLRYVERSVRSNQLRGEHQLNDNNKVEWSLSNSGVRRIEPARSDLAYGYEFKPGSDERLPLAWLGFIPEAAKRTSGDLTEDVWTGDLSYNLMFGRSTNPGAVKVGGSYRNTNRDALSSSYNLRTARLNASQRAASPDELFYGRFTAGSEANIVLEPNSAGGTYGAKDQVGAGFIMSELPLGDRFRLIGGARIEHWDLEMDVEPINRGQIQINRNNTDILPALALNVTLTEEQNLRLSATQTLARPEYRELAPISYRDMLGDREVFGDSSLVRTLVQNVDLRWEFYPDFSEVLSFGVFAKRFLNPIEQIDVATSGASQLSFINAESAINYGVEVEARKGLASLGRAFEPFGVFANATLMRSRINTGNSTLSALTNDERPMVGQAPYVINAGASYTNRNGSTSASLLYNVVGERIVSAAVIPISIDTYERPRHLLDFSLRFPLYGGMEGKFDAKNLLDSAHEERQGDVIRYHYRTGRSFSLGATWKVQ